MQLKSIYKIFISSLLVIFKAIVSLCLLVSCASTTTIQAIDAEDDRVDRNVKIYVDGMYKGSGEVVYSDTKILGSSSQVALRKKGCRTQTKTLSRSEQAQVGAIIGGIFFLPLFLWAMGYHPLHTYQFECQK